MLPLSELQKARSHRVAELKKTDSWPTFAIDSFPADRFADLLESGELSDFTIYCEKHEFKVHKTCLYVQSTYFERLLTSGFVESKNNVVTFKETTALAVGCVLLLIYSGTKGLHLDEIYDMWPHMQFPQPKTPPNGDARRGYLNQHFTQELRTLIDAYVLADRLMIQRLAVALTRYITTYIVELCIKNHGSQKTGPDRSHLASILEHIYLCTPSDDERLRVTGTTVCIRHMDLLVKAPKALEVLKKHEAHVYRVGIMLGRMLMRDHDEMLEDDWTGLVGTDGDGDVSSTYWKEHIDEHLWHGFKGRSMKDASDISTSGGSRAAK